MMTSAVVGYKGIYKRRWIQNVEWVFCDCLIKMIEEVTLFKFHSTCHRAFMVYQILFYSNWWPIPVSIIRIGQGNKNQDSFSILYLPLVYRAKLSHPKPFGEETAWVHGVPHCKQIFTAKVNRGLQFVK